MRLPAFSGSSFLMGINLYDGLGPTEGGGRAQSLKLPFSKIEPIGVPKKASLFAQKILLLRSLNLNFFSPSLIYEKGMEKIVSTFFWSILTIGYSEFLFGISPNNP